MNFAVLFFVVVSMFVTSLDSSVVASTTTTISATRTIKLLSTSAVTQTPALPLMRKTSDDNSFQSPVTNFSKISNTFQPRWKISVDRYDMHRGIDFYGAVGEPIYSAGTGVVHSVDNTTSGSDGRTIFIEHSISSSSSSSPSISSYTFHNRNISRVFTVYNHLDALSKDFTVGESVAKGQQIGTMGSTGDTTFVHLHFETRLETYCSLQYQVENNKVASPTSKCNGGFDPHVHPFLFMPEAPNSGPKSIEQIETLNSSYVYSVRYNTTRGHLDFDRLVTNFGTVGINLREGMNASTIAQLDDLPRINEYLSLIPGVFQSTTGNEIYFDFHFRVGYKPTKIEVYDIYGNGIAVASSELTSTSPSPGGNVGRAFRYENNFILLCFIVVFSIIFFSGLF